MTMCWRDGLSTAEHMASFRALQARLALQKQKARNGDKAHIDRSDKGTRYYRRDTMYVAFVPLDTVELLLQPGTRVRFDEIPASARTALRIGRRRKIARVVVEKKQTGFDFGKGEKYFPLKADDQIHFTVLSIPRTAEA